METVSISHNGRLLATGSRDGNVVICKLPSLPTEGYSLADVEVRNRLLRTFLHFLHLPCLQPKNPRGQSRTAEIWLNRNNEKKDKETPAKDLKQRVATEAVKPAMEDESAAWLKRTSAQQKHVEDLNKGAFVPKKRAVRKMKGGGQEG